MAAQYVLMLRGVRDNDPIRVLAAVKSSVLWMLAMIFTYAIFIPNHWVRAAKLIVPMALAPMAVPWILGLVHPEFYQVAIRAANLEKISEDGLFLLWAHSRPSSAPTPSTLCAPRRTRRNC